MINFGYRLIRLIPPQILLSKFCFDELNPIKFRILNCISSTTFTYKKKL